MSNPETLGVLIPIIAVGGGLTVAVIAVIGGITANISRNCQRERTRREIAAYVAEGSISPEEGERLMEAGALPDK